MSQPQPRHLRIFLSSPGDVANERGLALKVIEQLPYDAFLRGKITLEAVAWDKFGTDVPMLVTMTPQEAINLGLPKPSVCDIVIVLFWSRMGTPLSVDKHGTKPDGTPYLSGTEWEYLDAVTSAKKSGMPLTLVYRRTEKPPAPDLDDPKLDEKREQYRRVKAFFETFTAPDGTILQSHHPYTAPDDFQRQFENHLKHLIKRLLEDSPQPAHVVQTKPSDWPGSPFPGLRAFTPADDKIFFGRERETTALVKRVAEQRFVAVVGASGSGKSSLVGAGLIPRLRDNAISGENLGSKDWHTVSFKPGQAQRLPFEALYNALLVTFPAIAPQNSLEAAEVKRKFIAELRQNPTALTDTCAAILAGQPAWAEVLLFIDQFEELFTLVTDDEVRRAFIALLAKTAQAARVRIVATLRADFYHRCVEFDELAQLLRDGSFPLAAPTAGALYEMITRPAARAGLEFEAGLAERILDDTGTDTGALALMAYTLDELYRACERTHSRQLTHAAYEALGGVQGAIGTRAQTTFTAQPAEVQAALPAVFRDLVEVDERGVATRQRAALARVADSRAKAQLVATLTEARLLVQSEGQDHQPVVEVAHEALFRSWQRLKAWIDDTQADLFLLRQVRQAVQLWDRGGHREDFLWTGQRLKDAQAMVKRLQPILIDAEREFLRSEVKRLEERLNNPALDHAARARIGEQLHIIGDTRPGVGLRPDGLPDIAWCYVDGGEVTLENGKGPFRVQPFYIARYPITYVQFQTFLDAPDGFNSDSWGEGLQKKFSNHPRENVSWYGSLSWYDSDSWDEGLQKDDPDEQRFKFSNHPRENVSWYDAMAFCRWLTVKLPPEAWPAPLPQAAAQQGVVQRVIRLPMEWEWQQAATGGKPTHKYPWGPDWDGAKANTDESGLSRTTAVGMYPLGAAPCGARDMSGNVREWCLNEYKEPKNIAPSDKDRVVRGGSFNNNRSLARAACRNVSIGLHGDSSLGFRVVAAPKL